MTRGLGEGPSVLLPLAGLGRSSPSLLRGPLRAQREEAARQASLSAAL